MEFYDALEAATKSRSVPLSRIGLMMGHNSSYISNGRSRGSLPKVDTAAKILSTCDYSLCVVRKNEIPDNAIEIDGKESE